MHFVETPHIMMAFKHAYILIHTIDTGMEHLWTQEPSSIGLANEILIAMLVLCMQYHSLPH